MALRSVNRFCRSLLAMAALGSGLFAQSPGSWFAQFDQNRIGPARQTTQPMTFACGHAKVIFTGRWAPILAGEHQIGYFLEGRGQLEYGSAYEPEWPVLTRNLKDWMGSVPFKSGQTQSVSFAFTQARILSAGAAMPPWEGGEAPSLEDIHRSFDERWQKVDGFAPSQLLAAQAANSPERPVTILEMEGNGQSLLYRFDQQDAGEE